jgi:hypothetical protein
LKLVSIAWVDQPADFGGLGEAPDPAEYILAAIGASLSVRRARAYLDARAYEVIEPVRASRARLAQAYRSKARAGRIPVNGRRSLISPL